MKRDTCLWVAAVLTSALLCALPRSRAADSPVITPQQIEAVWLRQEELRETTARVNTRAAPGNVRREQDAAGGCDGVKDGNATPKVIERGLGLAKDLRRRGIQVDADVQSLEQIVERMTFWKDLVKQGLKTPVEMPGDTRSDCHAWGSHPLFHLHASVAGVRPASAGFRTVRIAPLPGKLPKIVSSTPHPDGFIKLDLAFDGNHCRGGVGLPAAITGVFVWQGKEQRLSGGANAVDMRP